MQRFFIPGLIASIFVVILDQWSKAAISEYFHTNNSLSVQVTGFFNLVLVHNPGISFGMLSGNAVNPLYLTIATGLVALFLLNWLRNAGNLMLAIALGLTIGGAIGNIIDRMRFGAVIDFLDFYLGNYHWPAFNIADSAICLGVFLLCIDSIFEKSAQEHV